MIAKQEKEEFNRIIEAQKAEIEVEHAQEEQKAHMRKNHQEQLKGQINEREELQKQIKRDNLEEITLVKKAYEDEKKRLLQVKEKKMKELLNTGVPEKYQVELAKKKVAEDF